MKTLDDSWNAKELTTFHKRDAKDCVVRWPNQPPTHGIEAHEQEALAFYKTFPDQHLVNNRYKVMIAQGEGYDAAAFGRDFSVFLPFVKKAAPDMLILGPGGVGEGIPLAPIGLAGSIIKTEDILEAAGPQFDGFSWQAESIRSRLPRIEAGGITRAAAADIDTLEERLRQEAVRPRGFAVIPPMIVAFAHKP